MAVTGNIDVLLIPLYIFIYKNETNQCKISHDIFSIWSTDPGYKGITSELRKQEV